MVYDKLTYALKYVCLKRFSWIQDQYTKTIYKIWENHIFLISFYKSNCDNFGSVNNIDDYNGFTYQMNRFFADFKSKSFFEKWHEF